LSLYIFVTSPEIIAVEQTDMTIWLSSWQMVPAQLRANTVALNPDGCRSMIYAVRVLLN